MAYFVERIFLRRHAVVARTSPICFAAFFQKAYGFVVGKQIVPLIRSIRVVGEHPSRPHTPV